MARPKSLGFVNMTVGQLSILYLVHAQEYYVKNGRQTSEVSRIRAALKELVRLSGPIGLRLRWDLKSREPHRRNREQGQHDQHNGGNRATAPRMIPPAAEFLVHKVTPD